MHRKTFTFAGKRYSVSAKTETALAVKVAMKKRDLEEGKKRITKNMLVREWGDKWLTVYKEPAMSARGYASLKSAYEARIKPKIGNMRLADVKPMHCQHILYDMAGLSGKHIKRVHESLA
jgi:hypothetical protein